MPSVSFKWSKELTCELISNFEKQPALYDRRHPDYNNTSDAYDEVLKAMVLLKSNITLKIIKRKWRTLYNQFTRELRLVDMVDWLRDIEYSKKSGAGADDLYEPRLWCYKQMVFLKPHCNITNFTSLIDEIERKRMPSCSNEELEADEVNMSKRQRMANKKKNAKLLIDLKNEVKRGYVFQNVGRALVEELERNAYSESGFFSLTHNIVHPSSSKDDLVKVPILYVGGAEVSLQLRKSELTESNSYAPSVSSSSKDYLEEAHIRSVEGYVEDLQLRKSEDREIRPASSQSDVAKTSLTKDILQLAMEGVFDPEDFLTDI